MQFICDFVTISLPFLLMVLKSLHIFSNEYCVWGGNSTSGYICELVKKVSALSSDVSFVGANPMKLKNLPELIFSLLLLLTALHL